MPAQTFSGSSTTDASVESVWRALDDPKTWEAINGVDNVFDEVRDDAGRLVGFKFHSTAMGNLYVGAATPGPRNEQKSLTWNIATSEIKGRVVVDLAEGNPGTRVDVTMDVESVSMMASFGFPVIAAVIGNGFQKTVDNFAANLGSPAIGHDKDETASD